MLVHGMTDVLVGNKASTNLTEMASTFCRLVVILIDICPVVLRKYLEHYAISEAKDQFCDLKTFLDTKKKDLKKLSRKDFQLIFDSDSNEEKWDVSTLSSMIVLLFPLANSKNAVKEMKEIRNDIFHSTSIETDIYEKRVAELNNSINAILNELRDVEFEDEIKKKIDSAGKREDSDQIVRKILNKFSAHEDILGKTLEETKQILEDVTRTEVDKSGRTRKRLVTDDHMLEKLKGNFAETMKKELDESFIPDNANDIKEVKDTLEKNRFVVLTGDDKGYCLKLALAAIKEFDDYDQDNCVEIQSTECWTAVKGDKIKTVLWKNPFGQYIFSKARTENIQNTLESLYSKSFEANIGKLRVIIVTDKSLLGEAVKVLGEDCTPLKNALEKYRKTTEDKPIYIAEGQRRDVLSNKTLAHLLRQSDCILKNLCSYKIGGDFITKAKGTLKDKKTLALVGSKDHLIMSVIKDIAIDGDFQQHTLILSRPGDIKHIDTDYVKLVILRILPNTSEFDMLTFDTLHAMAKENAIQVVVTFESSTFNKFLEKFNGGHPLLKYRMVACARDGVKEEDDVKDGIVDIVQTEQSGSREKTSYRRSGSVVTMYNPVNSDRKMSKIETKPPPIKLKFEKKMHLKGDRRSFISGICFVDDDMLVAADAFGKCLHMVCISDDSQRPHRTLTGEDDPWDVTAVNRDSQTFVAVTFHKAKSIRFYSVQNQPGSIRLNKEDNSRTINTESKCRGIANLQDTKLIVCCEDPCSVKVFDIQSRAVLQSFQNENLILHEPKHVALSSNFDNFVHIIDKAETSSGCRIITMTFDGKVWSEVKLADARGIAIYTETGTKNAYPVVCSRGNEKSKKAGMYQIDMNSDTATEINIVDSQSAIDKHASTDKLSDPNCVAYRAGKFYIGMNHLADIAVFAVH
ncbi:uncharacterized protein LOC128204966 isoform X1 [Mya arenaria]|uniref:uncharacterized protein LOC128204966 isoform X1 n=1 Tax=Mya arenaria TaxID=6604 RepID=UPI0022DF41B4|nr:uncharacterized protein LOC128204966 isoform X1 [Mya arenaria]